MSKELIYEVYSSNEVLNFTYECAVKCSLIKGVFIECGVAAGSQLAMMKQAIEDLNFHKTVIGFDSYQGIPYATTEDSTQPGIGQIDNNKLGLLESTGVSSHDIKGVKENFEKWKVPTHSVEFIEGWFQDTVPVWAKQKHPIALLRLDGDLYSSTDVCMKYLFPLLQKGGILIIDDYELAGCAKAIHKYIDPKKIIKHLGIAYYVK